MYSFAKKFLTFTLCAAAAIASAVFTGTVTSQVDDGIRKGPFDLGLAKAHVPELRHQIIDDISENVFLAGVILSQFQTRQCENIGRVQRFKIPRCLFV